MSYHIVLKTPKCGNLPGKTTICNIYVLYNVHHVSKLEVCGNVFMGIFPCRLPQYFSYFLSHTCRPLVAKQCVAWNGTVPWHVPCKQRLLFLAFALSDKTKAWKSCQVIDGRYNLVIDEEATRYRPRPNFLNQIPFKMWKLCHRLILKKPNGNSCFIKRMYPN